MDDKLRGIYVASKVRRAPMWRLLQRTFPISASWIFEAGEGETADYSELAARCIREVSSSRALILYCEAGDILKGALIEIGAALQAGIPVFAVGDCESISRVFCRHPLWHKCACLNDAVEEAMKGPHAKA